MKIEVGKDLVHLAYTGGTTGVSKGVILTHPNVVAIRSQFGNWITGAEIEDGRRGLDGGFSAGR